MKKRILSMLLVLCMMFTVLPSSALAEETNTPVGTSGEIIAFAPLTETEKSVMPGTPIEDLGLPASLMATVQTALAKDSGSLEQAAVAVPVTWASAPDYDMNKEDAYVFTPVITGYKVSANLPKITVTVGAAPRMMLLGATPSGETTGNLLVNPGGEVVTNGDALNSNGWSSDSNRFNSYSGNFQGVASSNEGSRYMAVGAPNIASTTTAPISCYQKITIPASEGWEEFSLTGYLCATGNNKATLRIEQLDKYDTTLGGGTKEQSVAVSTWTKVTLTGALLSGAKSLRVTIEGSIPTIGAAAFDALYLNLGKQPPTLYNVWVGSTQVTSVNAMNVLGDGTVAYTPAIGTSGSEGYVPQTLTLSYAYISTANAGDGSHKCGIYSYGDLNIMLDGDNTIAGEALNNSGSGNSYGILVGGSLNISGSGSLDIIGGNASQHNSYGIFSVGSMHITDATVNAVGGQAGSGTSPISAGVGSNASVQISSGTVTATGGTSSHRSVGIDSSSVTISGGKVTASGATEAMPTAPVLTGYTNVKITASATKTDGTGTSVIAKDAIDTNAEVQTYKYLKFEPAPAYAAEIGSTGYATLQAAVDAVADGQTIKLLSNITESINISSGRPSFTIDLNGKTLDGGSKFAIWHNGTGTLTIQDTGMGGTIKQNGNKDSYTIYNALEGTVNIVSGKVEAVSGKAIYAAGISKIIISGNAHITSAGSANATIALNGSGLGATLTIKGGTIENTGSGTDTTAIAKRNSEDKVNVEIPTGNSAIVKSGGAVMTFAPTLTNSIVTASTDVSGMPTTTYNAANIASYKFLNFEPAPAAAPTATTAAATDVTATTAKLNGSVNANYANTTVTFEYGTTATYDSSVTASQSPVTGGSSAPVSASLSGLAPNTTYHYRVKAVNSKGTIYGADMTFTTIPTYTLTYKPGTNGTGSVAADTKTKDVALTLKGATFTRNGYTQTGWATTDGGAKVYNLSGSYTANEAVDLYPVWTANTYTITYKPGTNCTGSDASDTKTHDVALTLKGATFNRNGYTQTGWATTDGGAKAYDLGGSYTSNAAIDLYPVWTANTYAVAYKPGTNCTDSAAADTKTHDVALTLKGATFTRNGYTQTGWATTDGGAKAYDLGGSYTSNAAIDIYPVWTAKTYTITYKPGTNCTGSNASDTKTHDVALTLKGATFTRNGYTQTGWATTDGGAKAYDLGGSYTSNAATDLYPVWTAKTYTVTYIAGANGTISGVAIQTISHGGSGSIVTAVPNTGYHFVSWSDGVTTASRTDTNVTGSLSVTANFEAKTYTITYKPGANGTGSAVSDTKTYDIALTLKGVTFTRTGFTQTGWATTDGGIKAYDLGGSYTSNAATDLYPVWTADTYTITLNANGGNALTPDTLTTGTDGKLTGLPVPTHSGSYSFSGWFTQASGGTAVTISTVFKANTTIFAHWTAPNTVSVSGEVKDHENNPVQGAVVKLKQGATETVSTATDAAGNYEILNVPAGIYNMVVNVGGKTYTFDTINVAAENVVINPQLPSNGNNTVLNITGVGTPNVAVDGLGTVSSNENKDIAMRVEKKTEEAAPNASNIRVIANGKTLDYFDISLTACTAPLHNTSSMLELIIPFDFACKQNISVFRYHDNTAKAFVEADTGLDGTFKLDRINNVIRVYADKFSTYAIGYTTPTDGGDSSSSNNDEEEFWDEVLEAINEADKGDVVKVNAKSFDKMSWDVMQKLYNNKVGMLIEWSHGKNIHIPAGKAVNPSAEAGRIYYPLSYLEKLFAGKQVEINVPNTNSNINPETGGVIEAVDNSANTTNTATLADTGVAKNSDEISLSATPNATQQSNKAMIPILVAIFAFVVLGGGYWYCKKHKTIE